jgi:hypothetical protein
LLLPWLLPFRVVMSNTRTKCNHCASNLRVKLKDFEKAGVKGEKLAGNVNAA